MFCVFGVEVGSCVVVDLDVLYFEWYFVVLLFDSVGMFWVDGVDVVMVMGVFVVGFEVVFWDGMICIYEIGVIVYEVDYVECDEVWMVFESGVLYFEIDGIFVVYC